MLGIASPERLPGELAKYPTLREQGLDVVTANSYTVLLPNGLTPEQIAFWSKRMDKVWLIPDFKRDLKLNFWTLHPFAILRRRNGCSRTTTRTADARRTWDAGMNNPLTLFEKDMVGTWIVVSPQGEDAALCRLQSDQRRPIVSRFRPAAPGGTQSRRPERHLAVTDHYLPTINRALGTAGMTNPEIRRVVEMLDENSRANSNCRMSAGFIPIKASRMSFLPSSGFSQPGMLITCNDSHTATNGACGALAVPIGGGNQLRHVIATQTVWLKKPKTMRISSTAHCPTR